MPLWDKNSRSRQSGRKGSDRPLPAGRYRSSGRRLCRDAMLAGVALLLSYLEALLPLNAWIPLPGFRLGWANLAVMLTFFLVGRVDAAAVSALRVLAVNLLFGGATTLWFSVCGAILSYAALWLGERLLHRFCSMIGWGILSAVGHNIGQLMAATLLFGTGAVWHYLPFLLVASVVFGGAGGWILNGCLRRLTHGGRGGATDES